MTIADELGFSIDDEFSARLPALSAAALNQLRQNIIDDRMIREPLVVWKEQGILVDGHNRVQIYDDLDEKEADQLAPPQVVYRSFAERDDVLHYIDCNAVGKRNIDLDEERIIRGRIYNYRKKRYGGHLSSKTQGKEEESSLDSSSRNNKTRREVAKELGVGQTTIRRDALRAEIHDAIAEPELAREVKSMTNDQVSEVARRAKSTSSDYEEAARDVLGKEPAEDIEGQRAFTAILEHAKSARRLLRKLDVGIAYLSRTKVISLMTDVIKLLELGRPHALCPHCGGDKCQSCNRAGYVNKKLHEVLKRSCNPWQSN